MPEIGQTLSHYKILEKIGEGGMGEVYLADDTTLDRKVALKFLPDAFTSDPERMARFEREAKLLASLNHPNIAGIYGLEQADGNRFLVLEYVEGETLQARLSKGALPLEEALALCRQIAEGLEAAHEKGVIHRDLKPANVMITAEEKVKILDFGLAKAFSDETQGIDSSQSPTLTEAMTRPGVILGTAAYMSPEQAKGKSVDKRADIWAFGCILYECLTGKRAFEGETVTETLAAVLRGEPNWNRLPPNIHPRIRLLLERCLKKESQNRYRDIGDASVDIQEVLADPSGVLPQPVPSEESRIKFRTMIPWLLATLVLGAVIAGFAVWKIRTPEKSRVISFDFDIPEEQQFNFPPQAARNVIAVSPDGSQFVYCTPEGMYRRAMKELTAKLIPGTEKSPMNPFFSPDGKSIGYYSTADMKLKTIPVAGGTPSDLCDVSPGVLGAVWNSDDTIIYGQMFKGIMQVSASGGSPETLIEGQYVNPQILRKGKSVMFTDVSSLPGYKTLVRALDSGEQKELVPGFIARYLKTGYLVYAKFESENSNNINLIAVPVDRETLEKTGKPVPIIHNLRNYAVSDSGTLVYLPGAITQIGRTLVWVDRNGNEEAIDVPQRMFVYAHLSPDDSQAALDIRDQGADIWILDLVRKTPPYRLTFDPGMNRGGVWAPDGKRVAFSAERDGAENIYWQSADGSGTPEPLTNFPNVSIMPLAFSPDGKQLLYGETSMLGDISILSVDGSGEPRVLIGEKKYDEGNPQISSDGRWLVYQSNESGSYQIWVRPFPDVDAGRWQVTTEGGTRPVWNPNNRELFYYVQTERAMMAIPVETTGTSPKFGAPVELFRGDYLSPYLGTQYSVTKDGQRFLMIKSAEPEEGVEESRKIIIVTNWFEELKGKVPVD
jgi:serine/threonine protein kinase